MKIFCCIFILSLMMVSCKPDFKYKVTKENYFQNLPAVFYTDTLEYTGDSLGYHNSDGKYILISDSFEWNCKIDTLKK